MTSHKLSHDQRVALALNLSKRILIACAKFGDEMDLPVGDEETRVGIMACQATLISLLANHSHGDILRATMAETLVDGTADEYIREVRNHLNDMKARTRQ